MDKYILIPEEEFWERLEKIIFASQQKALVEFHQKQNQKKLLTIDEVCEELHVSPPKVFAMLKSGQLDRKQIPGCRKTYISREQLSNLVITIKPYKRNG